VLSSWEVGEIWEVVCGGGGGEGVGGGGGGEAGGRVGRLEKGWVIECGVRGLLGGREVMRSAGAVVRRGEIGWCCRGGRGGWWLGGPRGGGWSAGGGRGGGRGGGGEVDV